MKKVIYYIQLAAFITLLAGCSSYESDYVRQVLELESSDVVFNSTGGSGTIVAKPGANVTAVPDKDWIGVSVAGRVVTVTVGTHFEPTGRYGLVKVSSGGKSIDVPVTQTGNVFSTDITSATLPFTGGQVVVGYETLQGITAVDNPEPWIEYELLAEEVVLTIQMNNDKTRSGIVTLHSGDYSVDITVRQTAGVLYEQLLGNWTAYSKSTAGVAQVNNVVMKEDINGESYLLGPFNVGSNQYDIMVEFDPETYNIFIRAGQYLGPDGNNEVYITARDGNAGQHSFGSGVTYQARNTATGFSQPVYTFFDNGSYTNQVITGIHFYSYSGGPPGTGSQVRSIQHHADLVLEKDDPLVP